LRVLKAATEKRHPDPADVAELRDKALSFDPNQPIDMLACDIINRELAVKRAKLQASRSAAT
jgi:hypothetical protein